MSENLNRMTLSLNEPQCRVLYEILNLSGVELETTDSLESVISQHEECEDIDVAGVCHRLFNLMHQHLVQFEKERDI